MTPIARTPEQRRRDTVARLEQDVDAWIATASATNGAPYLVPLSFTWDGSTLLIATPADSITGRNLRGIGTVRVGLGPTRDVVLIDGTVRQLASEEITAAIGDTFAAKTGFDPRALQPPYAFFHIQPVRIQAWREANELDGRDLMRDGNWLVD